MFTHTGHISHHHAAQSLLWLKSEFAAASNTKKEVQEAVFNAQTDLTSLREALSRERHEAELRLKEKIKSER